ncbi:MULTISPECIES: desulfoferrodoxin family protein [Lentihominibacter]|nr:desulfoferrodoxin family protein [Lentihominibacter hominis]
MNMKFYKCEHCGNIITFVENKGVPVMCCGQKMTELVAGSTDAAQEKHVPVVEKDGDKVKVTVSSVEHPMLDEHYIQWVCLETKKGSQIKYLKPGEKPEAEFVLDNDEIVAVYEYCNLHGLWKA